GPRAEEHDRSVPAFGPRGLNVPRLCMRLPMGGACALPRYCAGVRARACIYNVIMTVTNAYSQRTRRAIESLAAEMAWDRVGLVVERPDPTHYPRFLEAKAELEAQLV